MSDPAPIIDVFKRHEDDLQEINILVREVRFRVGELSPTVTVRIYYNPFVTDAYSYDISHYIKTPKQAGRYVTSHPFQDSEALALDQAIKGLNDFYKEATAAGTPPSDAWLVPNERWR